MLVSQCVLEPDEAKKFYARHVGEIIAQEELQEIPIEEIRSDPEWQFPYSIQRIDHPPLA